MASTTTEPVTSVQQALDGNAILVSTLDSTIRLIDKRNGQLLQSYKGHVNKEYRIRSCLAMQDSMIISGSEDGKIYAWDLLTGNIVTTIDAHEGKVASAVTWNRGKKEWASAGTNGTKMKFSGSTRRTQLIQAQGLCQFGAQRQIVEASRVI